jgi:hypothetical protein
MTPAMVHYELAPAVRQRRQLVLDAAYAAHPDRFVRRPPTPLPLPNEVWINKPQKRRRKYSLNFTSECLKVVDTRRRTSGRPNRFGRGMPRCSRSTRR